MRRSRLSILSETNRKYLRFPKVISGPTSLGLTSIRDVGQSCLWSIETKSNIGNTYSGVAELVGAVLF